MTEPRPLRVAVCVTTRNRERMLGALLDSFAAMALPEDAETVFVIVENNEAATMDRPVAAFRAQMPETRVLYEVETDLGIPLARNAACRIAVREAADLVLFVDDDEFVDAGWLTQIVQCYRETAAMLIGGPVMPVEERGSASLWSGMIRKGIEHRYREKSERALARHREGSPERITIVTNNWLADARIFTEHDIWFDVSLRHTGGSDTQFCRDVRRAGLSTAWCPEAIVYETIPGERATFGYQYRRAMEQSRTSLSAKLRDKGTARAALEAAPVVVLRALSMLGVALSLPVTRGPGLIRLARGTGWTMGRITGIMGARSTLYTKTTGS